ncbi:flagellar biosynthesis regulator FlaF [Sneathiella limimaris]|uniref:flagellar biosynthesis regulator FlaF n=1 Tax=Sneathiella limimaris TaxID=1964213 RepID=UPI00146CA903|nr:flagellar biosynthesis regulator FlaF [Sneathiella limimaris]
MFFEAYKKANLSAEHPAQTEYRLFAEITGELVAANKPEASPSEKINAIFRNSQLWLTLHADLMSEDNGLNKETKAGLISLALWVNRFTSQVMRTKTDLEPLIAVNKDIMAGLRDAAKQKTQPVQETSEQAFSEIAI